MMSSGALDIAFDRPFPQNPEAEREVLSAILWNGSKVFSRVRKIVDPSDFYKDAHRLIFDVMSIVDEDGDIEPGLVIECLRSRGELDMIGGRACVDRLLDSVPNSAQIEKYATMVKETSSLRRVIKSCHEAIRGALDVGANPDEVIADLEVSIADLRRNDSEGSRDLFVVVTEAMKAADERVKNGELLGVRTSLRCVNECLLGYQRGALTVLAANTSVGKTAYGLQAVEDAVRMSESVRAVSYQAEMTANAVAHRFLARNTRIPLSQIREWKLDEFQQQAVNAYTAKLRDFKRRLYVSAELRSLSKIIADMKHRKAEDGLDLAVIDYLQLINGGADEATREREVSSIAWRMVEVAQQLNIAVLALSQVTSSQAGRLTTESLRESKAIGHHARNVLILDRPRQVNKADTSIARCYTTLQVEKQSEGDVGDFVLHFDGRYQFFTEGGCPTGCPFEVVSIPEEPPVARQRRR
jgi:replicative DNA helicase